VEEWPTQSNDRRPANCKMSEWSHALDWSLRTTQPARFDVSRGQRACGVHMNKAHVSVGTKQHRSGKGRARRRLLWEGVVVRPMICVVQHGACMATQ